MVPRKFEGDVVHSDADKLTTIPVALRRVSAEIVPENDEEEVVRMTRCRNRRRVIGTRSDYVVSTRRLKGADAAI